MAKRASLPAITVMPQQRGTAKLLGAAKVSGRSEGVRRSKGVKAQQRCQAQQIVRNRCFAFWAVPVAAESTPSSAATPFDPTTTSRRRDGHVGPTVEGQPVPPPSPRR